MEEPPVIRLLDDYLNLESGVAFPEGTLLVRNSLGQYHTLDALIMDDAAGFDDLKKCCDIEVVDLPDA